MKTEQEIREKIEILEMSKSLGGQDYAMLVTLKWVLEEKMKQYYFDPWSDGGCRWYSKLED